MFGEREACDGARNADAEPARLRFRRDEIAFLVEEDIARRIGRSGFAIIDGDVLRRMGEMHEHEAAAAEIAGAGKRHRQGEAGGDGRIDRIAAAAQNIDADRRRRRLLADDHPMFGDDRLDAGIVGNDRLRLGLRQGDGRLPQGCTEKGRRRAALPANQLPNRSRQRFSPIMQEMRGSSSATSCTGRAGGGSAAISRTSLLRVASTKEFVS